jgi:hypothetical protein
MVSSWTGGRRLGFMTTAFATLVGRLLFVRPFGASRPLQEEDSTRSVCSRRLRNQRSGRPAACRTQKSATTSPCCHAIAQRNFGPHRKCSRSTPCLRSVFATHVHESGGGEHAGAERRGSTWRTIWELFPGMDTSAEETLRRFMSKLAAGLCETYYSLLDRQTSVALGLDAAALGQDAALSLRYRYRHPATLRAPGRVDRFLRRTHTPILMASCRLPSRFRDLYSNQPRHQRTFSIQAY